MVNLAEMSRIIRSADKVQNDIELAEARATRTTIIPTGMPSTKRHHSLVEEGAVRIADLKDVYAESMNALQRMRSELSELIDTLPDMDERIIMKLKYVKGYSPEAIADSIHMSERNVYRHMKLAKAELCARFPDRFAIE